MEVKIEAAGVPTTAQIEIPDRTQVFCGGCREEMDYIYETPADGGLIITAFCKNCMHDSEVD